MKSSLKIIVLLQKLGIRFILQLRSAEVMCRYIHLLLSGNCTGVGRCGCAMCSLGCCQNIARIFAKRSKFVERAEGLESHTISHV